MRRFVPLPDDALVLGVDPGIRNLGLVVLRGTEVVQHRIVETKPTVDWNARFALLFNGIREMFEAHQVLLVSIEFIHGVAVGKALAGETSAEAQRMREVVGCARTLANIAGVPVVDPAEASWKSMIGMRRTANYGSIEGAVERLFNSSEKLKKDAAAAACIARCGLRIYNSGR